MKISKYRHLAADKREIKDFPKLPLATSFIRKTLCVIIEEIITFKVIDRRAI